ncbi:alpha/beta hydrolase [uncultured Microscilla sp.]|uniref:alpha/beta hydrolase n=1 Tax=uncultured Microscilla sp. TaxID=432653 RepID=UPI00261D2E31|nr:alpha/beta hydrolase [uncultured Microscilla sp.]
MQKIDVMQYIPQSRERLDQLGANYIGADNFEAVTETIEGVNCAWIKVPNASSEHIILHLHGGAYFQGSIKSHTTFSSQISSRTGINTLLPEFGRAPEAPFPQGLNECVKLYRYLLKKFKQVTLVGDSSGGGLALALIERLIKLDLPLPQSYVGIYPWVDVRDEASREAFESVGDSSPEGAPLLIDLANLYCNGESKTNSLISPIFSDLTGYPPMLIQIGTKDFLYPQCTRFAKKAKSKGVDIVFDVYKDMLHGWHLFAPDIPENGLAYDNIAKFVKKQAAVSKSQKKMPLNKTQRA